VKLLLSVPFAVKFALACFALGLLAGLVLAVLAS